MDNSVIITVMSLGFTRGKQKSVIITNVSDHFQGAVFIINLIAA